MAKVRQPNFTNAECSLLLELVEPNKCIIECKRTDMSSRIDKERQWNMIEELFNLRSGEVLRDKKVLKSKYENLKKNLKKKVSDEKKYVGGTGGGPPSQAPEYSNIDARVRDLLGDERLEGLPSSFDNDAPPIVVTVPGTQEEDAEYVDEDDATQIEVDQHVLVPAPPTSASTNNQFRGFGVNEIRKPRSFELLPATVQRKIAQQHQSEQDASQQGSRQPCDSRQQQGPVSSVLQRRAELHNTRPYRKSSEKQAWEEVGKAKLELIKIQTEIAAEELRRAKRKTDQEEEIAAVELKRAKRKTEQEEEEHQLKLRLLRELHMERMRLMRDD